MRSATADFLHARYKQGSNKLNVSGVHMAVKRMIVTVDARERKTLQMDVTVIMKAECSFIVKFYGALFREGEVATR